ncbi:hypothetical protein PInf_005798 [Phytophthora infestans]|nr:hypothetical protein PInf_005798 [Phytophthora infestans]
MAATRRLRLEQLQRLCDDGKRAELHSAIATYSTKELRTLCGGFGVPAQSKEYAAYQSKAGYSELLIKLLEARAARTGLTEFVPINATPSGRTRKTKNCTLRLINVIFSTEMGPFLADLMDDVSRRKRTVDGANPLWEKVRTEFLSSKAEYARIRYPDDPVFADFNLGLPVAHSGEKLHKMWAKLGLAYTSVYTQFSLERNNVSTGFLSQFVQPSAQSSMEPAMEGDEGERVMKSIKLAYDVLAVMPAADRGSEIEQTCICKAAQVLENP